MPIEVSQQPDNIAKARTDSASASSVPALRDAVAILIDEVERLRKLVEGD